jgi:hypothetical protein
MSKLSDQQKKDILAAIDRREEDIDLSDIPEIMEIPPDAIRGKDWHHYRGNTIILDDEIHAYFCAIADRKKISINQLVNDVLAKEMVIAEVLK